jgi:hypothetical protein
MTFNCMVHVLHIVSPHSCADPSGEECATQCGPLTALTVTRQVLCRKVCIFPDFAGLYREMLCVMVTR